LSQQAGKPNKCRFYYFRAWLSERLKGGEEAIQDTSAELRCWWRGYQKSYSAVPSAWMPSVSPPQKTWKTKGWEGSG